MLLVLFFAAILRACAESFGVKSRCVEGVGAAGRARRSFHRTSTEPLSIFVTGPKPERGTSRFDGFASVFANRFRGVFSSLGHAKRRFRVDSEIDSANHVRLSRCQSGTSAFVAFRGLLAWCGARRPPNRVPRLTSHRKKRMAAVSMTFRAAVAAPAKLLAAKPSARASATAKVGPPPIIRTFRSSPSRAARLGRLTRRGGGVRATRPPGAARSRGYNPRSCRSFVALPHVIRRSRRREPRDYSRRKLPKISGRAHSSDVR